MADHKCAKCSKIFCQNHLLQLQLRGGVEWGSQHCLECSLLTLQKVVNMITKKIDAECTGCSRENKKAAMAVATPPKSKGKSKSKSKSKKVTEDEGDDEAMVVSPEQLPSQMAAQEASQSSTNGDLWSD